MGDVEPTDRKRLHITPFSAALLDRFIPQSLAPSASNISFHTVEIFPERAFGYVELPTVDAEKLKKKLNGMTLKGGKVHIEDAKPEKKRKAEVAETEEERKVRKKVRKEEKRKREEGVLAGHELEEGRRVKRGWTSEGSEKKRDRKSKKVKGADGVDGRKARLRTSVPPNKASAEVKTDSTGQMKKVKKEKKEKAEKSGKRNIIVVQEFAQSQKPDIAEEGSAGKTAAVQYEDSIGWVDENGKVVEALSTSTRPKRHSLPDPIPTQTNSSSKIEDSVDVDESDSDEAISSVLSSDPPSEDVANIQPEHEVDERVSAQTDIAPVSNSQSTAPERTPVRDLPEPANEVHPLEALFKRPAAEPESASKLKPSPIDTSFSFFTSGPTDDVEDEGAGYPPQTPHTKEDLEWRSMRSAAPTPDTAAIGKRFDFSLARDEDEDEDEEEQEGHIDLTEVQEDVQMSEGSGMVQNGVTSDGKEESAFRKWFYDNRGDLNRTWKKRRRDERKQKRQRENKRFGRRIA